MSYDIYTEPATGFYLNYTYNIQPMTALAGLHSLTELDGVRAAKAANALTSVLDQFDANPQAFRALNPPNRWGDFDGFRSRLRELRDHLRAHPKVTLRVG